MSTKPRRLFANLDCESDFALAVSQQSKNDDAESEEQKHNLPGQAYRLSPAAKKTSAALGTLLRAFLRQEDRLWLPTEVDSARLPALAGLNLPVLETGDPASLEHLSERSAWGETESCAGSNDHQENNTTGDEELAAPVSLDGALYETLWHLPRVASSNAARANDRASCLELAKTLGAALPGACVLASVDELVAHLDSGGASASPGEEWVLKARFSASGRWRHRGKGRFPVDAREATTIGNLFNRFGPLIFEPWMLRTDDFGCTALVTKDALCLAGFHRQDVDGQGRFRGLEILSGVPESPWFTAREAQVFQGVIELVARYLRTLDYVGPFGIDAWRFEDARGVIGFQPLGEINARMTFGLVARAWIERLLTSQDLQAGESVTLRLGKDDPGELDNTDGCRVLPLLLPGADDPTSAWLEVRSL